MHASDSVTAERLDPETLAAFLDGTASPEERESVLRTLARSKEAYASFLEAAAVHREVEDQRPATNIAPSAKATAAGSGAAKRARRWFISPLPLAASIGAVLLFGRLVLERSQGSIELAQATRLTRESGPGTLSRTFGDAWDQPPWSVARGADGALAPHPRAFRAGVRYAELEVAAQSTDSGAARRAAEALAQLLSPVETGATLAAGIRGLAGAADFGGRAQRAATAKQVRATLGADDWFDVGVWTETARLAVTARDLVFFARGGPAIKQLRRILRVHGEKSVPDGVEWGPVVDALRPLLADRSWSTDDLDTIDRAVRKAIVIAAH
jgi:hypothetical protein